MSDQEIPVGIAGAGFSGSLLAVLLARKGISSVLLDGRNVHGFGAAYSTRDEGHLLNVRAESMSAFPDEPSAFADYWKARGGDPRGFAPRFEFGRYVQGLLKDAMATTRVRRVDATATAAFQHGGEWRIKLDDGGELSTRQLVLATGNEPPRPPKHRAAGSPRLVTDPWHARAFDALEHAAANDEDVLIIGTGLTMVDLVLSLDARGHSGRMVAVSRRGLVPRSHADFVSSPVNFDDLPAGGIIGLSRWLRGRARNVDWRAAVDSLRPHSQALWQALGREDKLRFLRHARPWWDVHRHRVAPSIADRISELRANGRLQILAGSVGEMQAEPESIRVAIRARGSPAAESAHRFGYVFKATGPSEALAETTNPLLRHLLAYGYIEPDDLGMAIAVDASSAVRGQSNLWALGALTKGRFWEVTAVPDIRVQAANVAQSIQKALHD